MKKYILTIKIILLFVLLAINIDIVYASNNPYEDEVYPQSIYKKGIEPPYSPTKAQEINIDNVTSSLEVKQTDLYLKGKNGLDFALTRYYNLSDSYVYEPDTEGYGYNGCYVLTYNDLRYNIGTGWAFDLPSVEIRGGSIYLHYGSAGTWEYYYSVDSEDYYISKDYKLKDIRLKLDYGFSYDGRTSWFMMYEKSGKKTYFDEDGRIIGIIDRFGNRIRFKYTTYEDPLHSYEELTLLSEVIDSCGRKIIFSYDYPNNKIKIAAVDGGTERTKDRVITYNVEQVNYEDIFEGEYRLTSVTDAEGRTTSYTYVYNMALQNFYEKEGYEANAAENYMVSLNKISYPAGGATYFGYKVFEKHLGEEGTTGTARVTTKYDLIKGGSAANDDHKRDYVSMTNRANFFDVNGISRQTTSYDAYPYTEFVFYDQFDPDDPRREEYADNVNTYEGTKTINDRCLAGETEEYLNNRKMQVTQITKKDDNTDNIITFEYDANLETLKKKVERRNSINTLEYMDRIEVYDYNLYRDLEYSWDPQAKGNTGDIEHRTTYTYHPDYHYITSKIYKKDSSTEIKEIYEPYATDGRKIKYFKVYENNVLKQQIEYIYDSYGNVIEERKYKADLSTFTSTFYDYDKDNDTTTSSSFDGAYLTRTWFTNVENADGNLVEARSGLSAGTIDERYRYGYFGDMLEYYYGDGSNKTTYEYDKLGRVTRQTNPDNTYSTLVYNNSLNTVTFTDERGKGTEYDYDEFGNLKYEKNLTKNLYVKEYDYDVYNRLQYEYDNNRKTTITYVYMDRYGRLASKETIDNATGAVLYSEEYFYNDAYKDTDTGKIYYRVKKTVNGETGSPESSVYNYYNESGFAERMDRQGGTSTQMYKYYFTNDYLGNAVEEKSPRASKESWTEPYTAKIEYDFAGRPLKRYNVKGDYETYQYNELGEVAEYTSIKGNKAATAYSTEYRYDSLGRLIEERVPFENTAEGIKYSVKKLYYDRNSNTVKEKVSSNNPAEAYTYNETVYEYNNKNWLKTVIKYDKEVAANYTQYYHDNAGNVLRMYTGLFKPLTITGLDIVATNGDEEYSVTEYEYNELNKVSKMIDPMDKEETYEYDLKGNMITKLDRNNCTTVMVYDGMDRLTERTVKNSDGTVNASYAYQYYITGTRKSMVGGGFSTSYEYDGFERLKKETGPNGVVKEYSYDYEGNRKTFVLKKDDVVRMNIAYEYDKLNRLQIVKDNGTAIAEYQYDDNGNRKTLTYPVNGQVTEYDYNLSDILTKLTNSTGATVVSKFDYTYYLDGNQRSMTDSRDGMITEYTYDGLSRLKTLRENSNITAYSYDNQSNIKTKTVIGGIIPSITIYSYDKNNRLEKSQITANGGNIETQYGTANRYDGFNQLTGIVAEEENISYAYDGDGLRLQKVVNGVVTNQVWDMGNIVMELDGTGNITAKYLNGINLIASDNSSAVRSYYLYNGHEDVVQLADTAGVISRNYNYDAYGNEKAIDTNDTNPFRYSGQYYDNESGMYYLRARYYDPRVGRFISEDTNKGDINNPSSLNLYTYCWGNPLNYIDFDGHNPKKSFWEFLWGAYKGITGSERVSAAPIAKSNDENKLIENDKSTMFNVGKLSSTVVYNNDLVFDASVSTYYVTIGYSKVVSLKKDIDADYIHVGAGPGYSLQPVSFTVSCGIVNGINEAKDYAGPFHDVSANGMLGIDYCYWPNGAEAWLVTMGNDVSTGTRIDYYILIKDKNGLKTYQIVPQKVEEEN